MDFGNQRGGRFVSTPGPLYIFFFGQVNDQGFLFISMALCWGVGASVFASIPGLNLFYVYLMEGFTMSSSL